MKKLICLIMAFCMIFIISGCSNTQTQEKDKLSIVAVSFPEYDFARAVAGDLADIKMLIPPAGEAHGYEPTVSDIKTVSDCDLFIYTGSESDAWIDKVLSSIDSEIKTLKMTDCVKLIEVGHDHDHEENEDNHTAEYDEHVWTSPLNAIKISEAISKEMQDIDKENSESYKENTQNYIAKLQLQSLKVKAILHLLLLSS